MDEFILYLSRIHTPTHGSYVLNNGIDKVKPANHNPIFSSISLSLLSQLSVFFQWGNLDVAQGITFLVFYVSVPVKEIKYCSQIGIHKNSSNFPNYHKPTYKNSLNFTIITFPQPGGKQRLTSPWYHRRLCISGGYSPVRGRIGTRS